MGSRGRFRPTPACRRRSELPRGSRARPGPRFRVRSRGGGVRAAARPGCSREREPTPAARALSAIVGTGTDIARSAAAGESALPPRADPRLRAFRDADRQADSRVGGARSASARTRTGHETGVEEGPGGVGHHVHVEADFERDVIVRPMTADPERGDQWAVFVGSDKRVELSISRAPWCSRACLRTFSSAASGLSRRQRRSHGSRLPPLGGCACC